MHYYKFKVNKIINKITKKYNQQKIINEMKRDLEEKHDAELMNKSLETIVTNKRIKKKEKCFSDYREASFLCKFIMYNRSPESFLLIEKIFKECVSEFPRNPYIYLDFWNHLHGILLFVSRNKKFYPDSQSIADDIHVMSNRILYKVCNLEINFKIKYLIYNASHCYELEKEKFKRKDNANETSNDDLDLGYEVEMVKNIAINYHVKSIVSIKNMINELKNYNSPRDVDNILIMNDELSDILSKAEKYYAVYVNKFSFSREAILLYVAFLRNILVSLSLYI
ncbi:hypothetical protein BCR36DRAFT_290770 [Piromyces finnis]|uniref:Uncharacterized protein n=1 Tax=Piromyces finnis TaxID=1754191 RepID=A0A1Y1V8S4_9FUNG|nr:hypothetical protein BCR36DRAFT_290770 [Piromyces finnis]|eukprot:ORX50005.1 hypothetical protein BCR36DRAFT_290770 [Piromyces finnis]